MGTRTGTRTGTKTGPETELEMEPVVGEQQITQVITQVIRADYLKLQVKSAQSGFYWPLQVEFSELVRMDFS